MEGRVKTRQPGAIPNSFGRQVGVLPISDGTKLRRGKGEQIPVGGTDISPDAYQSYQKRPPSGSSGQRGQSSANKTTHNTVSSRNRKIHSENDLESMKSDTPLSTGADRRSQSSRNVTLSSRGQSSKVTSNSLKKSPGSSYSVSSQNGAVNLDQYEYQTTNARSANSSRAPSSRTSTASSRSEVTRTSPATSNVKRSARESSGTTGRNKQDDLETTEEQDVKFIDVPSQRSRSGSKSKRSPGSVPGSAGQKSQENGKKPFKTVDPEEIVSSFLSRSLETWLLYCYS